MHLEYRMTTGRATSERLDPPKNSATGSLGRRELVAVVFLDTKRVKNGLCAHSRAFEERSTDASSRATSRKKRAEVRVHSPGRYGCKFQSELSPAMSEDNPVGLRRGALRT